MKQKIVPHLWFDKEAKEASAFYASVFPKSKVLHTSLIHNTPSGDVDVVNFKIMDLAFQAISAGPFTKPNPAISFMINFDPSQIKDASDTLTSVWNKLSEGGKPLMPLDTYPFSKKYGWVEDKYGFSWQLILTEPEGEDRPQVLPSLLFANKKCGKAEEARKFYLSVFSNSPHHKKDDTKEGTVVYYEKGQEPNKEGTVMFSDFKLAGTYFVAMDAGGTHEFDFNEAISHIVYCKDQNEIDYFWDKLSSVPKTQQCGWCKDKFGVSWQIIPIQLDQMMEKGTPEQVKRVTEAFLQMKKFEISKLEKAYNNK